MRIPLALAAWPAVTSALPVAQQPTMSDTTEPSPNFFVQNAKVLGPVSLGIALAALGAVGIRQQAQSTARSLDREAQGTVWQGTLEGGYQRWTKQTQEKGSPRQGQISKPEGQGMVPKPDGQETVSKPDGQKTAVVDEQIERDRARARQDELREARWNLEPQLWVDLGSLGMCIEHMWEGLPKLPDATSSEYGPTIDKYQAYLKELCQNRFRYVADGKERYMVPRYVSPEPPPRGSNEPMALSLQVSDVRKGMSQFQSLAGAAARELMTFQPVMPKLGRTPTRGAPLRMGLKIP